MPREVRNRALALLNGEFDPPPLRDATTVVLVPSSGPVRTYLMRRAQTMAFAPGMWVFPGGRVDARDVDVDVVGPLDPARMTAPSVEAARSLVVSAVREVFEETSVLLAVDEFGNSPVEDRDWERDRDALAAGRVDFADVLARRDLHVDSTRLALWTHWVTPEMETRRYDVRFFIAAVPPGQVARDVSGEADATGWFAPADALSSYADGGMPMLPPTVATLADLAGWSDVTSAWGESLSRTIRPLMPRPRLLDDETLTWDVVDVRDGSPVISMVSEPAGSEVEGTR